jgi:pimeloyl-ACP methyl ester carboxylesterase
LNPIRFGPAKRQMFGMLHQPEGAARHEAILLCNPFGQEAIRCHRLQKLLADQLARHGFHVLRFDYYGTGDSAGEDLEGDLDGWCQDVLVADAELRLRSGCKRVSWFGLRLGASIAALASRQSRNVLARLVLLDPVIDGSACLKEMADAHIEARRQAFGARWFFDKRFAEMTAREIHDEVLGFALSPILRTQLADLCAQRLATMEAEHVTVFSGPGLDGLEALRQQLTMLDKPFSLLSVETQINWISNEAMDSSIAPPELLKAVITLFKAEPCSNVQ